MPRHVGADDASTGSVHQCKQHLLQVYHDDSLGGWVAGVDTGSMNCCNCCARGGSLVPHRSRNKPESNNPPYRGRRCHSGKHRLLVQSACCWHFHSPPCFVLHRSQPLKIVLHTGLTRPRATDLARPYLKISPTCSAWSM